MTDPVAYIVDDMEPNRDLLESLMRTVAIATQSFVSGTAFLEAIQPRSHGCVLLDIRMPGLSGLETQKELKRKGINLPVIMVTAHADVPVAIQAMKDGAYEFVEKPFNNQALLDVVQRAFLESEKLRSSDEKLEQIRTSHATLSPREAEVMTLIANGMLNKQIAFDLEISQRTVEVHRANVMNKMNARSLADLVKMCMALDERSFS